MAGDPETTRDQQGRWKRGRSGNQQGRPVGARNRATLACEALLDGEAEAITQRAITAAMAGDMVAMRLCLERILPVRKDRPIAVELPAVAGARDLPSLMLAILQAVSTGEATPEEGHALAGIAAQTRQVFELADLDARVAALEKLKP